MTQQKVRKGPGAAKPSSILLVDDHPLVRERLAEVILRENDLTICGEAEDRHDALAAIARTSPDLVIVDLTLKSSDGLELIKDIHARWPKLRLLVVSMHDESLYAERVLRAGALGYITKQEATRKILVAIRRVLAGTVYLDEKSASRIISRLTGAANKPVEGVDLLTDRELQVFELTGKGLSIRDIAERLNIGGKTVETYRARIREKLQIAEPDQLLPAAIAWVHSRDAAWQASA